MERSWPALLLLLSMSMVCFHVEARLLESEAVVLASDADPSSLETVADVAGPKERACAICQQAAAELLVLLSDPQTTQQAVAIVEAAACANLPKDVFDKCSELVHQYVPLFVAELQEKANPDTLCVATKICTPPGDALTEVAAVPVEASPKCDICVQVASQILVLLEDGKTQEQILTLLHSTCDKVKIFGVSSKCDAVVDLYFPQLILLLESVSPAEACRMAHYCAEGQRLGPQARGMASTLTLQAAAMAVLGSPQECAACRFLVSQAKKKLKDPDNQVKLVVYLTDACNRVPDYAEECKVAVMEYLPMLFANIDSIVDPAKVCAKVNLCPAKEPWLLAHAKHIGGAAVF